MKIIYNIFIISVMAILFSNGCKNKDSETEPSIPTSVKLAFKFDHKVDDQALETNTIQYTNAAGNPYSVITLRYFISDVTIHKAGSSFVIDDEHYIDIDDVSTFNYTPETQFVNGIYDSITFTFGLNETKNVNGYFVNSPESDMSWPTPLGGGFHYMQLEGRFDTAGVTKSYLVHSGPSEGNQYFFNVSLPQSSFTANGEDLTVSIDMNINKWFTTPNEYDFNSNTGSIMSKPEKQVIIQQNGNDVFSIKCIE